MSEFIPKTMFQPFTGEIEDNNDPMFLGRVRVRIHGYHTLDDGDLPTEDLPWAMMAHPRSEMMSIPSIGEWVFGYFLDGDERQKPLVVGVIPGLSPEDEPTTSRWFRNEEVSDTDIYSTKSETTTQGDITEPDSPYGAEHPNNTVYESPSGHLIEIDDTSGAERIHIYHTSGTFIELHPDGSAVYKTQGDDYKITQGDSYDLSVGARTSDFGGEYSQSVNGNKTVTLTGKYTLENTAQDLKTLIDTLIDEIIAIQTVGSPANHTINPGTIAKLNVLKQQFALLLE